MFRKFFKKAQFSEHVYQQGLFFLRLKTITMCFKLSIFHNNFTGNVLEILQVATKIGIRHRLFVVWINPISKKLKKQSLMKSHFDKNTELQSTTKNSSKLHHRCSHEGALKLLHQKLLKMSRKMCVVEFPFNKIARLHSAAYYQIKNCTTSDAFPRSAQKRKNVLTFREFQKDVPFLKLYRSTFQNSRLKKNTPRKMFPVLGEGLY